MLWVLIRIALTKIFYEDLTKIIIKYHQIRISFLLLLMFDGNNQGVDLFQKMLKYEPSQRISAKSALVHPYFSGMTKQRPMPHIK